MAWYRKNHNPSAQESGGRSFSSSDACHVRYRTSRGCETPTKMRTCHPNHPNHSHGQRRTTSITAFYVHFQCDCVISPSSYVTLVPSFASYTKPLKLLLILVHCIASTIEAPAVSTANGSQKSFFLLATCEHSKGRFQHCLFVSWPKAT